MTNHPACGTDAAVSDKDKLAEATHEAVKLRGLLRGALELNELMCEGQLKTDMSDSVTCILLAAIDLANGLEHKLDTINV